MTTPQETQEPNVERQAPTRWRIELTFVAVLGLAFIYLAIETSRLAERSRLFPVMILAVAIPLTIARAITLILHRLRATEEAASTSMESVLGDDLWGPEARRVTIRLLTWLAGYMLLVWLLGLVPGLVIATFLYLRFASRASWWLTVVLTTLLTLGLYAILIYGLRMAIFFGPLGDPIQAQLDQAGFLY